MMMKLADAIAEESRYQIFRLENDLTTINEVVRWADWLIALYDNLPLGLFDLALAQSGWEAVEWMRTELPSDSNSFDEILRRTRRVTLEVLWKFRHDLIDVNASIKLVYGLVWDATHLCGEHSDSLFSLYGDIVQLEEESDYNYWAMFNPKKSLDEYELDMRTRLTAVCRDLAGELTP